ncbi:MAG: cytochrome P450 [Xenococcus sp. MO_188.B8]|nr:cytochrome P450 [Xenococcus sp. MO_188.B8]
MTTTIPIYSKTNCFQNIKKFQADSLGFLQELQSFKKNIVKFRLGFKDVILINEPTLIEELLTKKNLQTSKNSRFRSVLGNGLVSSEGNIWKEQRRSISPQFARRRLEGSISTTISTITNRLELFSEKYQDNSLVNFSNEMSELALDVALFTMFGCDHNYRYFKEVRNIIIEGSPLIQNRWSQIIPLPLWLPTSNNLKLKNVIHSLDKAVDEIISMRLHSSDSDTPNDLLFHLLNIQNESFPDGLEKYQQLRDEVKTFLIAGHETTGTTLSWIFLNLIKSEKYYQNILNEIIYIDPFKLSFSTIFNNLKFTLSFILETLRLYPPVWVLLRTCTKDIKISSYFIKKGHIIMISPFIVHRTPEIWNNPETFNPYRFIEILEKSFALNYFLPFGLGARRCIGDNFAILEILLVLIIYLKKIQIIAPSPTSNIYPITVSTLKPSQDIQLLIKYL